MIGWCSPNIINREPGDSGIDNICLTESTNKDHNGGKESAMATTSDKCADHPDYVDVYGRLKQKGANGYHDFGRAEGESDSDEISEMDGTEEEEELSISTTSDDSSDHHDYQNVDDFLRESDSDEISEMDETEEQEELATSTTSNDSSDHHDYQNVDDFLSEKSSDEYSFINKAETITDSHVYEYIDGVDEGNTTVNVFNVYKHNPTHGGRKKTAITTTSDNRTDHHDYQNVVDCLTGIRGDVYDEIWLTKDRYGDFDEADKGNTTVNVFNVYKHNPTHGEKRETGPDSYDDFYEAEATRNNRSETQDPTVTSLQV